MIKNTVYGRFKRLYAIVMSLHHVHCLDFSSVKEINIRHVFGLKADVKGNVLFIDEQTIVYPAGANVILYNIETKTQKFIHMSEKASAISAFALSSNRRYLAVAEKGEKPICVIYDIQSMRKRKTLTISDTESKVIYSESRNLFRLLFLQTLNSW